MNGTYKMALYQRLYRSQNRKMSVNRREHCAQKCERSLIRRSIIIMGPGWLQKRFTKRSVSPISPTELYAKFYAKKKRRTRVQSNLIGST